MVKVYVELVWDIHFPGKITRAEEKRRKIDQMTTRCEFRDKKCLKTTVDNKVEKNRP